MLWLPSCTVVQKYQKDKPFVFENKFKIIGNSLSKKEKKNIQSRIAGQLDDSARITRKDFLFLFHSLRRPPAYDIQYSAASARNMRASLVHTGYYGAKVSFVADTVYRGRKQKRVSVTYIAEPGTPTLIDTVAYNFSEKDLQELALSSRNESFLQQKKPVSKTDILAEISRLIDLYRNNGYYKFSSDNLSVLGDTTIKALTNISDDPFENLRSLAEAKAQRSKPVIRLGLTLNPEMDSSTIRKYFINNVFIYPDFSSTDSLTGFNFTEEKTRSHTIRFHKRIFKNRFLISNNYLRKGTVYRQDDYIKTINSYSKTGVWQNVNIIMLANKDTSNKLDAYIQLVPAKKYGFEANIESSYSANNNYSLGNLLGFSGNVSLQNRNMWKEGIKMTHTIHAGLELNVSKNRATYGLINSNDMGYTNTISVPKLVMPPFLKKALGRKRLQLPSQQTFVNSNISYTNRFNLFKLQNYNFALGWDWNNKKNRSYSIRLPDFQFSYLYNRSQDFIDTLAKNPFLKYSYNTAFVLGTSFGCASVHINKNTHWQRELRFNIEESGILWSYPLTRISILKDNFRRYVKMNEEAVWTKTQRKSSHVFRLFAGVGIPVGKSDSSLPFFKQYFAGGANSMRGWPVRGIGQGARPLPGYRTTTFNDRTGDVKLEGNYEYRYDIAQIIPNALTLKGALFIDAGNIWNFRNTRPGGGEDSLQFMLKNVYKQLGVAVGTGFRLDFNYFLIRLDLGFRVKRPDVKNNDGWQLPDINFNNLFRRGKMVPDLSTPDPNDKVNDERYKKWRYENFNFTIGIGVPF